MPVFSNGNKIGFLTCLLELIGYSITNVDDAIKISLIN